jgi:hypothetical protein
VKTRQIIYCIGVKVKNSSKKPRALYKNQRLTHRFISFFYFIMRLPNFNLLLISPLFLQDNSLSYRDFSRFSVFLFYVHTFWLIYTANWYVIVCVGTKCVKFTANTKFRHVRLDQSAFSYPSFLLFIMKDFLAWLITIAFRMAYGLVQDLALSAVNILMNVINIYHGKSGDEFIRWPPTTCSQKVLIYIERKNRVKNSWKW